MLLLHDGLKDIGAIAERIWYPIWDEGVKLGPLRAHDQGGPGAGRRRPRHGHLAARRPPPRRRPGPHRRAEQPALALWRKRAKRWLGELSRAGDGPPAKGGRGRLPPRARPQGGSGRAARRARHPLGRGGQAGDVRGRRLGRSPRPTTCCSRPASSCTVAPAGRVTRCCSRSRTRWPRPSATPSADALMTAVAPAARTIAWTSDEVWDRIDVVAEGRARLADRPATGRSARASCCATGGSAITADADPAADPPAGAAGRGGAAQHDVRIERTTLDRLADGVARSARPVAAGDPGAVRRAAARRPPGHRRDRDARPARPLGAHPPRVGAEPQPAPAQRLSPLHRRPAPVRDGGRGGRARRPGRPARPARASARCSTTSARAIRATTSRSASSSCRASAPAWATTPTTSPMLAEHGARPPAAARRRHPARPLRRGHHPLRSPTQVGSIDGRSSCSTP